MTVGVGRQIEPVSSKPAPGAGLGRVRELGEGAKEELAERSQPNGAPLHLPPGPGAS